MGAIVLLSPLEGAGGAAVCVEVIRRPAVKAEGPDLEAEPGPKKTGSRFPGSGMGGIRKAPPGVPYDLESVLFCGLGSASDWLPDPDPEPSRSRKFLEGISRDWFEGEAMTDEADLFGAWLQYWD